MKLEAGIIQYEESIRYVTYALSFWLLAASRESRPWEVRSLKLEAGAPLRGLPPLGAAAMDGGVQLLQDVA